MGGRSGSSGLSLYAMGEAQISSMTEAQRNALLYYSNGNGSAMNTYLREGVAGINFIPSQFRNEIIENTDELSAAIENMSLSRSVSTVRGGAISEISNLLSEVPGARENPQLLVGRTYMNPGFLSTTTDTGYAREFATSMGSSNGVFFHTNFARGARAVFVDPIQGMEVENELLGAPRTKFHITRAYNDNTGLLHIHMETK